jgi:hypothetical protein
LMDIGRMYGVIFFEQLGVNFMLTKLFHFSYPFKMFL